MHKNGTWTVGQLGSQSVIVDVLDHVAVAYLWSVETGITSHVWLFNKDAVPSSDEEPQRLSPEHMSEKDYVVPTHIADIEVTIDDRVQECTISWHGRTRALLRVGEAVGFSAMVQTSSQLAQRFGSTH